MPISAVDNEMFGAFLSDYALTFLATFSFIAFDIHKANE